MTLFKEVTEERYDEMLNVLPPLMWTGTGFLVGEAWTHKRCSVSDTGQPAFLAMVRHRGKFYESQEPVTRAEFRAIDPAHIVVE